LNIILVTGAHARARSLTLDWRHAVGAGLGVAALFVLFTLAFNYVTLRWAAAAQHPWLQAIVLADQRAQMQRVQERVQAHLSTMAVRLGELQAQMLRLDTLGARLAQSAGLKPQELSALRAAPARGGAESTREPARDLTLLEFTQMLDRLARQVDARTDQLNVLEALLLQNSTSRRFLPTLPPILDGWFSSNFGPRIDPFTGQRALHDGIDFPAERGTPIQAAASGKVVFAGTAPEYGKMVDIDHGNGLVTRYAHASRLLVKEGDVVVAGQPIAAVGTTGRSTGPHLHFEVRQNGVPQNPARFLTAAH
jgi:murein DD-endopeptidase MepM/ murein hydrolase activator NlpD